MEPRGLRNNNPGNIRKNADKWQGLSDNQPDPYFCTFEEPLWGIRAMIKLFFRYQDKYKLKTIERILNRWAPPKGDNNGSLPGGEYTQNTTAYSKAVAGEVGVTEECQIDLHNINICLPFIKAVIRHENGKQPYPDELIKKAFNLAEAQ